MNTLKWVPFPDTDVSSYKIYRSLIGFTAPIVSLTGLTLKLKLNGGVTQTITFAAGDPVAQINSAITGGKAYITSDNLSFIFRSDIRNAPGTVEIVGGTALSALNLTTRIIGEKTEDTLIATVPADIDPAAVLTYVDPDGDTYDYYAISVVDTSFTEGAKSAYKLPFASTYPLCVIEGVVIDVQGVPVPDAAVTAEINTVPDGVLPLAGVDLKSVSSMSGSDGRFSIPILQGAIVKLEIPAIKYSNMVRIPEQPFAFFNDLMIDTDYTYPLGYRGAN